MGTRITFRYKNDEKPDNLSAHVKSIRFWDKGFCIAIFDPANRHVALIEEHLFEEDYPLNGKMHLLSETEGQWQTGGGIRLICFNRPHAQIPKELFNEADKNLYLQLLTDTPYKFTPMEELVEAFGLYNLSGWDKNLYHEILSLHPDVRLQSGIYLLLQLLARQEGIRKMVAFVEDGHLDIAAADGKKMLGTNSFAFNNPNDFLYYFAGFAHNTFGSAQDVSMYIGGEVEENSMIYTFTKKFFPSLRLLDSGVPFIQQEQHRYCDLLFQEE
ncbi:MAG: DUF3822 family protein [Bacteroidales bacterium]|jgi:hypothetical protein|nr:DUF3822 family protein [Bacteroidales bacterium]